MGPIRLMTLCISAFTLVKCDTGSLNCVEDAHKGAQHISLYEQKTSEGVIRPSYGRFSILQMFMDGFSYMEYEGLSGGMEAISDSTRVGTTDELMGTIKCTERAEEIPTGELPAAAKKEKIVSKALTTSENSGSEKSDSGKLVSENSGSEKSDSGKSVSENSGSEKSVSGKLVSENSGSEKSDSEKSVSENFGSEMFDSDMQMQALPVDSNVLDSAVVRNPNFKPKYPKKFYPTYKKM